jgi:hypothetical protein
MPARHELTTTVRVHPPPVIVMVTDELLLDSVAVTTFGLVDDLVAGIEMVAGAALMMPRLSAFDELYVTGCPVASTVSR